MKISTTPILQILPGSLTEKGSEDGSRKLLTALATLMSFGGLVWGSLLLYFEIFRASLIPFGYIVVSVLNMTLVCPRSLVTARIIQIIISLLLPFGLQWMLGGYFASGVVMLWSTLSLVGSITLLRGKYVYPWLVFFIVLTIFSLWIEPYVIAHKPASISPSTSLILLVINLLMISTIVFLLSKNKSDHDLQINQQLETANNELEKHKNKLETLVRERTEQLEANISLLKEIQEDMKKAKEEAEKANEAKSQFLANMSHEIRSPLNAILGFSQIMTMEAGKSNLSGEFRQYLDTIKLSGENLLELINNILDLSKIEAGKTELSFESVQIKQLFKGIYQINKGRAQEKDIKFSYEIDERLPDFVESDRTKLNQILMNLASNAVKFTPASGSVHMKLLAAPGEFTFEITDTGVGIASNRIPFIFEPFEQADNSITRKFGGTGLGLTITKKMCDLLGGKISVHSVENLGATFRVSLPLTQASGLKDRNSEVQILSPTGNESYEILVVEDNEINQQLMKILLRQLGARCIQAYNGKEGLDHLRLYKPDLIIMDIHMPVMDGMEAIRQIRAQPKLNDIPIICLTADAFSDQQRKAILLGANDYLTKPLELGKLVEIFAKYFGRQKVKTSVA